MTNDNIQAQDVARLNELVAELSALTERLTAGRLPDDVADADITDLIAAGARLFSARTDIEGKQELAFPPHGLNATQSVVLVTALMEAADINLFDLAIWYRRVA
ncbi:hypothetical protein [Sinisalibacter aestuarii]|uniref:Uncharacterized protein n=1 Tax=Sinisalibacter aestuarii TaxID=2949426 RepID=A0ABQ5LZQ9_9RHOB|nr:hypothetical protein [Sinisalibacter aestuarii]GKY89950.1 hypothetical protein STA1M1_38190 [Sinisalibacter aestuarii]